MVHPNVHDLDYLAARLHGRHSRLAEAERLDALCRLRSVPELGRTVFPNQAIPTAGELQRRLVEDLAQELRALAQELTGARARLLDWLLFRFALENIKVCLRGVLTGTPAAILRQHLLPLPPGHDISGLCQATSLPQFIDQLPEGSLRTSLQEGHPFYREQATPFFDEALLDRGYFRELLARAGALPAEDRVLVTPIVRQEADIFHLMLVVRAHFQKGLAPELLRPLHIAGTAISSRAFNHLLNAPDLAASIARMTPRIIDARSIPLRPELVEALAWARLLQLAKRAFRRSHMGFPAIVGYAVLRRIEVTNLITTSEGLRAGLRGETIGARLVPRRRWEADDV